MKKTLENIYSSVIKFLEPLSPNDTYVTVVNEAMKLVHAKAGSILLESEGRLKVVYNSLEGPISNVVPKKGFSYKAYSQNKAYVVDSAELGKKHPELTVYGVKTVVFIPLAYRNKPFGVLAVGSYDDRDFNDHQLEVLKLFASLASLAIRKTQLYQETKEALETRDLFLSLASHELRTPLTTINGYVQLLQSKAPKKATPESRWIEQLSWECVRMTNMIKGLLEVNLIKSGRLEFEFKECRLTEVVNRAVADFRFNYPKRLLVFENKLANSRDQVIGDFDKLLQAIDNLTDNAVKFSPANSLVKIQLKASTKELMVEILDQGQGIHEKDLPKLSQEFFKGYDNVKSGIGLGLFFSRYIIRRHHGSFKIDSKVGKGTAAVISLPKVTL